MSAFHVTVPGKPLPKGSLRHVGNGRLIEQTKVKGWMTEIRQRITQLPFAREGGPFDVPVQVTLEFRHPRPLAAKNRLYPHMRSVGDLDKLVRAVLDALQPTVLTDDSLVVSLSAIKLYETPQYPAGVSIIIEELT